MGEDARFSASAGEKGGGFDHEERIMTDIGLLYIKTVILLNAGAIVAILGFSGQVFAHGNEAKIISKLFFGSIYLIAGIVCGAAAIPCGYGQVSMVLKRHNILQRGDISGIRRAKRYEKWRVWLSRFMYCCAIFSMVLFVRGVLYLRDVMMTSPH